MQRMNHCYRSIDLGNYCYIAICYINRCSSIINQPPQPEPETTGRDIQVCREKLWHALKRVIWEYTNIAIGINAMTKHSWSWRWNRKLINLSTNGSRDSYSSQITLINSREYPIFYFWLDPADTPCARYTCIVWSQVDWLGENSAPNIFINSGPRKPSCIDYFF